MTLYNRTLTPSYCVSQALRCQDYEEEKQRKKDVSLEISFHLSKKMEQIQSNICQGVTEAKEEVGDLVLPLESCFLQHKPSPKVSTDSQNKQYDLRPTVQM